MQSRSRCLTFGGPALAQQARAAAAKPGPWFGVPLPPPLGQDPAVIVGDRAPRPVVLPSGEAPSPELTGATIKADVDTIVNIAKESRSTREIGSGQLWGRVTGLPSGTKGVTWSADQFRKAGISDVKIQPIAMEPNARFWFPLSWEVRLLADAAFGPGTADVVLESAIPLSPSDIPGGTLTAPLVYVGSANPSILQHIDVKGKIAVQLTIPQGHMVLERGPVGSRADDLVARGAAGVFNLVRLPGNERSRDFSDCGNPCFNIGGRDGHFLEAVMDRAAVAGVADKLRVRLTLKTETRTNLKAENAVAVVPGRSEEVIILNAHVDAWFDGAGDNADGLAVLVALARHFAKPENRPERTLVFVASAGHHSPGMNGPRNFVAANPDLAKRAVMMVNIEHVAQRNFSPARSTASDGYRQALADSGEAPIYAGITNRAPFLDGLVQQGVARYGTNFVSAEIEHVERRDRRLLNAQGRGPFDPHAGAAALPHDRRSRRRHLDARPRTHGALPGVFCQGERQGPARADRSLIRRGASELRSIHGARTELARPLRRRARVRVCSARALRSRRLYLRSAHYSRSAFSGSTRATLRAGR